MSKPKLLIVDDDGNHWDRGFIAELETKYDLLYAYRVKGAEGVFKENASEIAVITMDGCLGSTFDTEPLVEMMRGSGFKGPIIAHSSMDIFNDLLVRAGCSHQVRKNDSYHKDRPVIDLIMSLV
jgi:hypothetical protein